MQTLYRDTLPKCDICGKSDQAVMYDMPYQRGHWANVCESCRQSADNPDHPAGHKMILGKHPDAGKYDQQKELKHAQKLSERKLQKMMFDEVVTTADGCRVEPDGKCPHGYRSPLLVLGLM